MPSAFFAALQKEDFVEIRREWNLTLRLMTSVGGSFESDVRSGRGLEIRQRRRRLVREKRIAKSRKIVLEAKNHTGIPRSYSQATRQSKLDAITIARKDFLDIREDVDCYLHKKSRTDDETEATEEMNESFRSVGRPPRPTGILKQRSVVVEQRKARLQLFQRRTSSS